MKRRDLALAGIALGLFTRRATAQAWPERPVRWVLSQPAGSGPDNVARLLAEPLAKAWGQAVVIDNKPGGQNTIGAQAAARAPADGHSWYFATTAALVTNPLLFKSLPYDPVADFAPVAFIARSPFAILVAAASPLTTIEQLVARARAGGGTALSLGNEGPRTFSGIVARLFKARTQGDLNLVAYASVGVGLQDLIGGHVDAMVADLASATALARQGRLRVLATTAAQRVAGWEAVPALAETLPSFELIGWFALVAPTGTPEATIRRVAQDVKAVLADRTVAERIGAIGPIADASGGPAELASLLRAERVKWEQVGKEIGLLAE